jgi:hypothetical protein
MASLRNLTLSAAAATVCLAAPLAGSANAAAPAIHSVGSVTRHAAKYVNQEVILRGYLIGRETGYILFSDEPRGHITRFDLPVMGGGIETLQPMQRYIIEGTFLDHGLTANNANPDHLELTAPPQRAKP